MGKSGDFSFIHQFLCKIHLIYCNFPFLATSEMHGNCTKDPDCRTSRAVCNLPGGEDDGKKWGFLFYTPVCLCKNMKIYLIYYNFLFLLLTEMHGNCTKDPDCRTSRAVCNLPGGEDDGKKMGMCGCRPGYGYNKMVCTGK